MKTVTILFLTICLLSTSSFSQIRITNKDQAQALLKKGKTQEVAGIIVSSVGFVGSILGVMMLSRHEQDVYYYAKGLGLSAAGIATSIVGIVYLTSGVKKIKKANLFLNREHVQIAPGFKSKEQFVSVEVRINF